MIEIKNNLNKKRISNHNKKDNDLLINILKRKIKYNDKNIKFILNNINKDNNFINLYKPSKLLHNLTVDNNEETKIEKNNKKYIKIEKSMINSNSYYNNLLTNLLNNFYKTNKVEKLDDFGFKKLKIFNLIENY